MNTLISSLICNPLNYECKFILQLQQLEQIIKYNGKNLLNSMNMLQCEEIQSLKNNIHKFHRGFQNKLNYLQLNSQNLYKISQIQSIIGNSIHEFSQYNQVERFIASSIKICMERHKQNKCRICKVQTKENLNLTLEDLRNQSKEIQEKIAQIHKLQYLLRQLLRQIKEQEQGNQEIPEENERKERKEIYISKIFCQLRKNLM